MGKKRRTDGTQEKKEKNETKNGKSVETNESLDNREKKGILVIDATTSASNQVANEHQQPQPKEGEQFDEKSPFPDDLVHTEGEYQSQPLRTVEMETKEYNQEHQNVKNISITSVNERLEHKENFIKL